MKDVTLWKNLKILQVLFHQSRFTARVLNLHFLYGSFGDICRRNVSFIRQSRPSFYFFWKHCKVCDLCPVLSPHSPFIPSLLVISIRCACISRISNSCRNGTNFYTAVAVVAGVAACLRLQLVQVDFQSVLRPRKREQPIAGKRERESRRRQKRERVKTKCQTLHFVECGQQCCPHF